LGGLAAEFGLCRFLSTGGAQWGRCVGAFVRWGGLAQNSEMQERRGSVVRSMPILLQTSAEADLFELMAMRLANNVRLCRLASFTVASF
jgi:hypothetical protein